MRLCLPSFKLGTHPERLVALAPPPARVTIILNALDNFPHAREERLARQSEAFAGLGFLPEELDLRSYFRSPARLRPALEGTGSIWISGGRRTLVFAWNIRS